MFCINVLGLSEYLCFIREGLIGDGGIIEIYSALKVNCH